MPVKDAPSTRSNNINGIARILTRTKVSGPQRYPKTATEREKSCLLYRIAQILHHKYTWNV